MTEPLLVSACLMGIACRYDGRSKPLQLPKAQPLIGVCPEVMAGFGVPRPAIERDESGQVHIIQDGSNVTAQLSAACEQIVMRANELGIARAILKERSPSCGSSQLVRRGQIVPGQGILTERLRMAGITVLSDEDLANE